MALNPRIMAIPPQPTDREEHIHRFLTSLPRQNPDLGSNNLQTDHPDDPNGKGTKSQVDDKKLGELEERVDDEERGRDGLEKVTPEKDLEVERRRYERKIRRRDKAAILKPRPPAEKKVKQEPEQEPPRPVSKSEKEADLPDSWWEEHRQRKRGLHHPPDPDPGLGSGRRRNVEDVGLRRTLTALDTRKKEKVKKEKVKRGGIPGLEMIRNYKPSIPISGSRLTMRPQSKGLFGNGVSSDPDLLRSITGRQSNSRKGPAKRVTLRSSSDGDGDWRDEWRQAPNPPPVHQEAQKKGGWGSNLPPPGNTQSTSWPSQLPSSDGPSLRSRPHLYQYLPPQSLVASSSNHGGGSNPLAKYRQLSLPGQGPGWIGSESAVSRHLPLDLTRIDRHELPMRHHDSEVYTTVHYPQLPYPPTGGHGFASARYDHLAEGYNQYLDQAQDRAQSYQQEPVTYEPYPYSQQQGIGRFVDSRYALFDPNEASHRVLTPQYTNANPRSTHVDVNTNPNAVTAELEPEMQDFWKRRTPTPHPPPFSRPIITFGSHLPVNVPSTPIPRPMTTANNDPPYPIYSEYGRHTDLQHPPFGHHDNHANHGDGGFETVHEVDPTFSHPLRHTHRPIDLPHPDLHGQVPPFEPWSSSHRPPSSLTASPRAPQPTNLDESHIERGREEREREREVEEYGTTTDDWKSLWSSKPYR